MWDRTAETRTSIEILCTLNYQGWGRKGLLTESTGRFKSVGVALQNHKNPEENREITHSSES